MGAVLLDTPQAVSNLSYDFVIIGGGTSGLAVASRLSLLNPLARILVVEAGGDTRDDDKIKAVDLTGAYFDDGVHDWSFKSTTQSKGNKVVPLHQGLGLGGSSSINGAYYTLPPLSQLEAMLQLGDASFDAKQLFQHIKESQNFEQPTEYTQALGATANASAHSQGGPVTMGYSKAILTGPQENAFRQAQQQALHASLPDDLADASEHNTGGALVARTLIPQSGEKRTRVSSATALMGTATHLHADVQVLTNTRAVRMTYSDLDQSKLHGGLRADGVELQSKRDGPVVHVRTRNVVVCAGALRTPIFLQHSGIGDQSMLQDIGIDVKIHLPGVGKNLVEQQFVPIVAAAPAQPIGGNVSSSCALALNSVEQIMGPNATTQLRQSIETEMSAWAQDAVMNNASASVGGLMRQYRAMIKGIFEQSWPVSQTQFMSTDQAFIQLVWSVLNFSRGYVHAQSLSTWDMPAINPRYWSAQGDLRMQVAISKAARAIFQADAMRKLVTVGEIAPGFEAIPPSAQGGNVTHTTNMQTYETDTDQRWTKYILDSYQSVYHPTGTASMMSQEMGGVVDGGFKVHQTANVYVVDAGIVPFSLCANPTATLYGLAFAAAPLISKSSSLQTKG